MSRIYFTRMICAEVNIMFWSSPDSAFITENNGHYERYCGSSEFINFSDLIYFVANLTQKGLTQMKLDLPELGWMFAVLLDGCCKFPISDFTFFRVRFRADIKWLTIFELRSLFLWDVLKDFEVDWVNLLHLYSEYYFGGHPQMMFIRK